MEPLHILYEDPHLVICCKPVGVLSEDGQAGRCMPELLREHYRSLGQKNPYIATVHRLDKITGGVMVFSRRREVTGKITAAVQAHEIVKEYLAVLRGHPAEPAATLTDLLFRDAGHNKSYVDIRYGSKDPRCTAALWSCRLAFRHPVTGERVDVFCPPPRVYPWDLFPAVEV